MSTTYYWEHPTDHSRYLRSGNARSVAGVVRAQGGEVGVIISDDDGPLRIARVSDGSESAARVAAMLVDRSRAMAAG